MRFYAHYGRRKIPVPNGPWNDIPYVPTNHVDFSASRHQFDLELPSGSGPFTLGVFVHAGGFVGGSKDLPPSHWMKGLLTRGIALGSVGYRLAPTSTWPAQRLDIGAFVRYIKTHAASYNIVSDRIALVGYSAGAAIAAFFGVTANNPAYAGSFGNSQTSELVHAIYNFATLTRISSEESEMVTNFGSVTRTVGSTTSNEANLIGGLNPYTTGVSAASAASAYNNIQAHNAANAPGFMSLRHGALDDQIPYQQSANMATALLAAGYPVEYIEYASLNHSTIQSDSATTTDMLDDVATRLTS